MTEWTKSRFSYEELSEQSVEFELTDAQTRIGGIGKFRLRQNPQGLQAIEIVVEERPSPTQIDQHILQIRQHVVDRIEIHPDQTVARYLIRIP